MSTMDEFQRLDKIIRDCEQSIALAERLKSEGRWRSTWDAYLAMTESDLAKARHERDWLDASVTRISNANKEGK